MSRGSVKERDVLVRETAEAGNDLLHAPRWVKADGTRDGREMRIGAYECAELIVFGLRREPDDPIPAPAEIQVAAMSPFPFPPKFFLVGRPGTHAVEVGKDLRDGACVKVTGGRTRGRARSARDRPCGVGEGRCTHARRAPSRASSGSDRPSVALDRRTPSRVTTAHAAVGNARPHTRGAAPRARCAAWLSPLPCVTLEPV